MIEYQIAVIDPPWPKKKGGTRKARPNQGRSLDYATLPLDEIFSLLDREIFPSVSHHLFVWTIDQFLFDCEQQMESRGFCRHARLIWDKTNGIAPAFTVRYSHEYLLWYYRRPFMKVAPDTRGKFKTVFTEQAREHSRKPDCAYKMIMDLFPCSTRIDVFSREIRAGWHQWGDQCRYFSHHAATEVAELERMVRE